MRNCPKCKKCTKMTKHHVLPRRFFGSPPTAPILLICRKCHDLLETYIPQFEQQPELFYWKVLFDFLETDHIHIQEWSGNIQSAATVKIQLPVAESRFKTVLITVYASSNSVKGGGYNAMQTMQLLDISRV